MSRTYYFVEFDPSWKGVGVYSGQGNFLLIPEIVVEVEGLEEAFKKLTGHDPVNIVKSERVFVDELGVLLPVDNYFVDESLPSPIDFDNIEVPLENYEDVNNEEPTELVSSAEVKYQSRKKTVVKN
jgi:hypothetical protein